MARRRGVQQRLRSIVNQKTVFAGIARIAVRKVDFGGNPAETALRDDFQRRGQGDFHRVEAFGEGVGVQRAETFGEHNLERRIHGADVQRAEQPAANRRDGIAAQRRRNLQHVGDFRLVKEAGTVEQNRAARRKLVVKQPIRIEDIRRFVAVPVIFRMALGVLRSSLKMNLRVQSRHVAFVREGAIAHKFHRCGEGDGPNDFAREPINRVCADAGHAVGDGQRSQLAVPEAVIWDFPQRRGQVNLLQIGAIEGVGRQFGDAVGEGDAGHAAVIEDVAANAFQRVGQNGVVIVVPEPVQQRTVPQTTDGRQRDAVARRRGVQQRLRVAVNQEAVFAGIARIAVRKVDFGLNQVEAALRDDFQRCRQGDFRGVVAVGESISIQRAESFGEHNLERRVYGAAVQRAEHPAANRRDGIAAQRRRNLQRNLRFSEHVQRIRLHRVPVAAGQNRFAIRNLVEERAVAVNFGVLRPSSQREKQQNQHPKQLFHGKTSFVNRKLGTNCG